MRRKLVSEKTLELNVSASILEIIRSRWPGCQDAFWIGMKQYQEARNGIDELLSNMPAGRHLALQFKAHRRDALIPSHTNMGSARINWLA